MVVLQHTCWWKWHIDVLRGEFSESSDVLRSLPEIQVKSEAVWCEWQTRHREYAGNSLEAPSRKKYSNHTKSLHLNSIHSFCVLRHAVSPVHFLHHVLCSFVRFLFLFFFSLCLFDLQLLFLNTCQKVINGVGWLDERHGLSPILYNTAPIFVYTDQLLCHCVFICSNFR